MYVLLNVKILVLRKLTTKHFTEETSYINSKIYKMLTKNQVKAFYLNYHLHQIGISIQSTAITYLCSIQFHHLYQSKSPIEL